MYCQETSSNDLQPGNRINKGGRQRQQTNETNQMTKEKQLKPKLRPTRNAKSIPNKPIRDIIEKKNVT